MPHKLLLADDSVTIQRVIELTFADEDVQVIAVGNGQQAIERAERDRPDIVLADIGMPERDGYEVAAFIKGNPALAHVPVVLLTGAFEPIDETRARAVGCDGVLVKPVADEKHVYFAARDRHCYCLSKDSGKLLWQKEVGSPVVAAPAVLDNHLYVAASKGMVYCLSCAGGDAIWPFDVAAHSQSRPQVYSSPAVIREEGQAGSKYHLFVGAGLEGALNSKAVLYCLEGPR